MQNKAKVKSAEINLSSFLTSKYVLIGHLVIQTKSQFKPNLSQLKPIQSQFVERGKIDAKFSYTTAYEENVAMGQKTKPIQSQFDEGAKLMKSVYLQGIKKISVSMRKGLKIPISRDSQPIIVV